MEDSEVALPAPANEPAGALNASAPAGATDSQTAPALTGEAPRKRRRRRRRGRRNADGSGVNGTSDSQQHPVAQADADDPDADAGDSEPVVEITDVAGDGVAPLVDARPAGAPAQGQEPRAEGSGSGRRRKRRRRGRGDRGDRPEAASAAQGDRPAQPGQQDRADRPERQDRPERRDRGARPARSERAPRSEQPDSVAVEPTPVEDPYNDADFADQTEPAEFHETGLRGRVLRAVADAGYVTPSEIQRRAIPVLLGGSDVIGGSHTGTGKTAAFALPTVQRLARHGATRALILEPTRELAAQVYEQFQRFAKYTTLRTVLLHGGVGYGPQREGLQRGADIIVATPGRLLDFIEQRTVSLSKIETLVLDEADRMLDMGFIPDVRRIVKMCPPTRQSMLFSATIPPAIRDLAEWMLKNPETIQVGGGTRAAETITHALYPVDPRQKFDLLVELLKRTDYHSVIIFCRTKVNADVIARWLEGTGHDKLAVLHSDRPQNERTKAMEDFRSGKVEILVATDIVARGIDISTVSHVINWDIPQNPEDYVHRIGRTGRMHAEGDAVTLVTADETTYIRAIEKLIGQEIPRQKLEGFEYQWTPLLEPKVPIKKRRNRGYTPPGQIGR